MSKFCTPASRVFRFLCVALLVVLVLATAVSTRPRQIASSGPKIWQQDAQPLQVHYESTAPTPLTGQAKPLAMASGDLDGDGVNDQVVGYAVPGGGVLAFHRGNLDAFAPQSKASFDAIAQGRFPSPFRSDVHVGDGNFIGSSGSLTTNPQGVTQTATTTTVTSSNLTITLGQMVTFTATVGPSGGSLVPTGLVTFFDGNTPLGSGTLTLAAGEDQASFSTTLLSASGSPHAITAAYNGNVAFASSVSSPISETVNQRASITAVTFSPAIVIAGQPTVTVGEQAPGTITVTDFGGVPPPPGTADAFMPTGASATGRTGFTSTLFADGLVLVTGGADANNNVLNSAEIYSVSGGTFSSTGNLNSARTGAVSVLLPNGKVLVLGGSSDGTANGALNSAELFDPSAGTFTNTSDNMTAARFGTTATLLNTGKVLIAGGVNSSGVLISAELYDPTADTFTATGNLNTERTGHSATLLGTGNVLIAGGSSDGTANGALNSAELFNGVGTFSAIPSTFSTARWQPEAAPLLSGKVLIAGGQNSGGALTSAEIYDETSNIITPLTSFMSQARANGSAVSLPNGRVLLAGGTTSQAVDLFDADSNRFNSTGSLQQSDSGLVSTLLNNGDVLVVGLSTAATPASDAELYSPSFNPLGTVAVTSSEPTDGITGACILIPSTSTASTCTSTVTPVNVATSPHNITGTYPADAMHSGSSNSQPLNVSQGATSTSIVSFTPSPSTVNHPFTVTVNVTGSGGTPTGSVTVSDGAGQNCTATLSPGTGSSATGSCSLTPIANGVFVVTAVYSGDSNFLGSTSPSAGQVVTSPPSISKAFGASQITTNGTTLLTFTIQNPNAGFSRLNGLAFTDNLPTGLGLADTGFTNSCGGTVTVRFGAPISLAGGSAISSCTISVHIRGMLAGVWNNVTGKVTSSNAGTGNTASASITVVGPPMISESFGAPSIALGQSTSLTYTISNHNSFAVALTGVTFTDNLPSGLQFGAITNNGTCFGSSFGGTISSSNPSTFTFQEARLPAFSSCTVIEPVVGTSPGPQTDSNSVNSTNGGTSQATTASINVIQAQTTSSVQVMPTSQQYSDEVTFTATLSPASLLGQSPATNVTFKIGSQTFGPVTLGSNGSATFSNAQILEAAGGYTVTAIFGGTNTGPNGTNPNFNVGSPTTSLTVQREDAVVTPATSNPLALQVTSPGGASGSFTLSATVKELADDSNPGDIRNAVPITISLTPVGPSTTPPSCNATVVNSGGATGFLTATCTFTGLPVNVYSVTYSVGGNYYQGSATSVLTVFDPSLGFFTGGGTLVNPTTGYPATFGLEVKFNKNDLPKGQIMYVEYRPTGNVIFQSNVISSMAVVTSSPPGPNPNNEAITTGKSAVNGTGNIPFQNIAIDYGGHGMDQFGLQAGSINFAPVNVTGRIQGPHQ